MSLHDLSTGKDSVIWPEVMAGSFSWSPGGDKITYGADRSLFITDLQRSFTFQIPAIDEAVMPRWAKCDDKILYCVRVEPKAGLYSFDLGDSTNSERLLAECVAADWLGGCDRIAVKVFLGSMIPEIAVFSVSAATLQTAPFDNQSKGNIAASPDGNSILVTLYGNGKPTDIWKLELSSMTYTQLTFGGADYPAWSPDGQWILYTKIDRADGYLWLMRPDGSEKHQITF